MNISYILSLIICVRICTVYEPGCVRRHVLEFLNLSLSKTSKNVCVPYKVHSVAVNIIISNRYPFLPRSDLFYAAGISKVYKSVQDFVFCIT